LSIGGEYTRVEKTKIVANIPESYNSLDVCLSARADGSNCSRCFKCMRTQLTLDIADCKQLYDGVFDSVRYKKNKDRYIGEIIANTRFHLKADKTVDPLIIEIDNFSKETNYKYPKVSYVYAILHVLHAPKGIIEYVEKTVRFYRRIKYRLLPNASAQK